LFFATFLIWELGHAAAKPWLFSPSEKKSYEYDPNKLHTTGILVADIAFSEKKSKTDSNLPLTVEELAAQKLIPVRASELPQCQEPKQKSLTLPWLFTFNKTEHIVRPWYCQKSYVKLQESVRGIIALALIPFHV
jgi:hypothetical protein